MWSESRQPTNSKTTIFILPLNIFLKSALASSTITFRGFLSLDLFVSAA